MIQSNSFALTTRNPLVNTYPAVGRLIHVTLNLPSVSHQVFHAPIFQGSWVRCGEDCLHTVVKRYGIQYSCCETVYFTCYNCTITLNHLSCVIHLQFVDKVVSKILSHVFMPGFSHSCCRRWCCSRHGTQVTNITGVGAIAQ